MRKSQLIGYAAAVAIAVCVGAGSAAAQEKRNDIVEVQADDPEMEAAKEAGRSSLPGFLARLASPAADETDFGLKFDLTPDRVSEFIWVNNLRVDSKGSLSGTLNNVPADPRFKFGQRVSIERSRIVDWTYRKGAVAQGHFTTRVLLDRIPADQAAQIRAAFGW